MHDTDHHPHHPISARQRTPRQVLWLFLSFQCLFLLSSSGRLHTIDEYEAFYMTESLVERAEFSLPVEKAFFGKQALDGSYYAPYGPLPAVVAAPYYFAGQMVASGLGLEGKKRESLTWSFTVATNSTLSAAAVAAFFLLCLRLGASSRAALWTSVVFALGTTHWHYATTFFSEPLSTLLMIVAALGLVKTRKESSTPANVTDLRGALIAGLPLAGLALVRLPLAIVFPVFTVAYFFRGACFSGGANCLRGKRTFQIRLASAAAYCAPPVIAIGGYMMWNFLRFGNPLEPGYPESLQRASMDNLFSHPFLEGLYGLILSPGKGLALFALPAIIGLFAALNFLRLHRVPGWMILALPVLPILFYSRFTFWEGGYCWGPRYLVPQIAFWVLPLAFLRVTSRRMRVALAALFISCGMYQAMGVSVSFLECQVQRGYYDGNFSYELEYSAPRETADVFGHYTAEVFSGNFLREAEGLGFDRWFLFLSKSGFSGTPLSLAVLALIAGGIFSVIRLRACHAGTPNEPIHEDNSVSTQTSVPTYTP